MQSADYGGRGSSAYDLGRFQPRRKRKRPVLVVADSAKYAAAARARARAALFLRTVLFSTVVIGVVVAMLYSMAILTELNAKINVAQDELNEMKMDTTRLQTQLETKMSMRNIEEYATQKLGMAPMDQSQITYINLNDGDKVELTQESPKTTLLDEILLAISDAKAYLSGD